MNQTYMKEKAIVPLLLSMSAPMILSMLINSLYNIIDSIFVAKYSAAAMTSLSLVYPLQNLIISISVGFGVGINVMIALNLGAGRQDRANLAATQGMVFNILHGIILNILGIAIMPVFLGMYTKDATVLSYGITYSTIVFCFSTVNMIGITFEKIYQALGKMVMTMISLTCGFLVNIILDPIMIFGFGPIPEMGITGAAWATGIGQTVSMLIYLVAYLLRPLSVKLQMRYVKPEKEMLKSLYSVGIPATLNMALPSLLISALNAILSSFSEIYVLILGIYYKLQSFLYLPANGIIQGMRPLISYNFGAGEKIRVKKIYRLSLGMIALLMGVGTIFCLATPEFLIGMFTDDTSAIAEGSAALRVICAGFLVSSVSVASAGALEALGKGVQSLCVSLLRYVVLILPAAFLLSHIFGVIGVWHAFWISELLTAFAAYGIYHYVTSKTYTNN